MTPHRLCTTAVLALAVFCHPVLSFAGAACDAPAPVAGVRDAAGVRRLLTGSPFADRLRIGRVSYLNYNDSVPRLKTLALAAYQHGDVRVAAGETAARSFGAAFVSASYFDLLGIRLQGRAFAAADDLPGAAAPNAVISDRLWEALFDRRPSAIGEPITVNGHRMTVVGVAEPGFLGVHARHQADVWMPGVIEYPVRNELTMRTDDRSSGGYYEFVARPASGATWEQAHKELQILATWLAEKYPAENQKFWEVGFHDVGLLGCTNQ